MQAVGLRYNPLTIWGAERGLFFLSAILGWRKFIHTLLRTSLILEAGLTTQPIFDFPA